MTDQDKNEIRQIIREELDKTFLNNGMNFSVSQPVQPGAYATAGFVTNEAYPAATIGFPPNAPNMKFVSAPFAIGGINQCPHVWQPFYSDGKPYFRCNKCGDYKPGENATP